MYYIINNDKKTIYSDHPECAICLHYTSINSNTNGPKCPCFVFVQQDVQHHCTEQGSVSTNKIK